MPHLAFHMSVARELAGILNSAAIDGERGAYYLGSTGPDMHVLLREDRVSSHHFDLECVENQNCVEAFFRAHGELKDTAGLDGVTTAFVAGYLTHLVLDELWVTEIYRPFFGRESALGGNAQANLLDRVLQYDMDLQRRRDRAAMEEIRNSLVAGSLLLGLGFLNEAALSPWRGITVDLVSQPPTWERFLWTSGRFLKAAGVTTEREAEAFMKTLPRLLTEIRGHVSDARLEGFLEQTRALSLRVLKEYLHEDR